MADTSFYDVVVCGGETAGLVAAALLARRGFRVLLAGDEAAQAAFEAGGAPLSRAPAVLPALDDPQSARVYKELDCATMIRRRAEPATAVRVLFGQQRLDLSTDAAASERELGRAFGASAAPVVAALERLEALGRSIDPLLASAVTLPPHGFWERRELGRLESRLPRPGSDVLAPLAAEHPFRAAAVAPAALSTALAPSGVGPLAEARALTLVRRGGAVLDGGLAALQEILLQRIETFGGDRRRRLDPVVVLRRGRAVGVRARGREETIGCRWLLWAGSTASLHEALEGAAPAPAARGRPAPLRVAGYRYAVTLLVGDGAFPAGTPARVLAIGDLTRPLVEDNALAITVGRAGPREPDRIPVWVECAVPAHLVDAGPSYLRALRGRLLHTLDRLYPNLGKRIAVAASPYDGLPPQRGSAALDGGEGKGLAAVRPPLLYERAAAGPFDVGGHPHATAIKNLLLVGRENLPGLGLEGELVSGWGAARLVGPAPVRRVPLRRRTLFGG